MHLTCELGENLRVIIEDLDNHPVCVHGPALLFSRKVKGSQFEEFFACSASRDPNTCKLFPRDEPQMNSNFKSSSTISLPEVKIRLISVTSS